METCTSWWRRGGARQWGPAAAAVLNQLAQTQKLCYVAATAGLSHPQPPASSGGCERWKQLEPQWGQSRQAPGSLPTTGSLGATFALLGHACARFWEWKAPGAQVGSANPGGSRACLTQEWEVESEWVLGATDALCPVHGLCNHLLSIYLFIFSSWLETYVSKYFKMGQKWKKNVYIQTHIYVCMVVYECLLLIFSFLIKYILSLFIIDTVHQAQRIC